MPTAVCRDLPTLLRSGALGSAPDRALLDLYRNQRDGDAFAALIRRHGPMVWGVCRRALGDHHAAEDAFQETFLVLARRAGTVDPGETVAPWLYGVAVRLSRKRRVAAARRSAREAALEAEPAGGPPAFAPAQARERAVLLDGELAALPGPLRAAVVLCDLGGLTRREASEQLNCPEGTVASRLARGRKRLADRLRRRGLDPAPLAPIALAGSPVPAALQAAALRAALRLPAAALASAGVLGWVGTRLAWNRPLAMASVMALGLVPVGLVGSAPPPDTPSMPPPAAEAQVPPPAPAPAPGLPEKRPAADPTLRDNLVATLDRASRLIREEPALRAEAAFSIFIARYQAAAGSPQALDATLDEILAALPTYRYEARHRAIEFLVESGRVEDTLKAMLTIPNQEKDREQAGEHAAVARGLALAGDLDWARRIADAVPPRSGYGGRFHDVPVEIKIRQRDWAGAREAVGALDEQRRGSWLGRIAAGQLRDGDPGAADTVRQYRELVDGLPDDTRKSSTGVRSHTKLEQAQVAGLLASIGEVEAAVKIAEALDPPEYRDYARHLIARAHLLRGRFPEARASITLIGDAEARSDAEVDLVRALVKSGDLDAARRECEAIAGDYQRVVALAELARAQAGQGRIAEAGATLAEARRKAAAVVDRPNEVHRKAGAYGRIARAQAMIPDRSGDGWIDALENPTDRLAALLGLADGLTQRLTGGPSLFPKDGVD